MDFSSSNLIGTLPCLPILDMSANLEIIDAVKPNVSSSPSYQVTIVMGLQN